MCDNDCRSARRDIQIIFEAVSEILGRLETVLLLAAGDSRTIHLLAALVLGLD